MQMEKPCSQIRYVESGRRERREKGRERETIYYLPRYCPMWVRGLWHPTCSLSRHGAVVRSRLPILNEVTDQSDPLNHFSVILPSVFTGYSHFKSNPLFHPSSPIPGIYRLSRRVMRSKTL
ncbi:hypothetical protein ACN38_g12653 [Penicillium nordicum]|uniref:Uncharacterized protein n=1 Tax=Penicillium nordicum TaxID=229535 RepID=A0A0M9W9R7_9EURO|nr:hypothetical protein ACN38_g12653 [Penicillium nordicum]